jgi:hypothetical protein
MRRVGEGRTETTCRRPLIAESDASSLMRSTRPSMAGRGRVVCSLVPSPARVLHVQARTPHEPTPPSAECSCARHLRHARIRSRSGAIADNVVRGGRSTSGSQLHAALGSVAEPIARDRAYGDRCELDDLSRLGRRRSLPPRTSRPSSCPTMTPRTSPSASTFRTDRSTRRTS